MFNELKKGLNSALNITVEVGKAVGTHIVNKKIAPFCKITGSHLFQEGNFQEAEKYYDQVIAAEPYNPNAYYNKGACLMNQQKYKEAIYYIDRALGIEPNHNLAKKAKETILEAIRKGQVKM